MHTIKWRIVYLWVCVCVYKIMFRHKHPILHFQQALNTLKSRGFPNVIEVIREANTAKVAGDSPLHLGSSLPDTVASRWPKNKKGRKESDDKKRSITLL